MSASPTRQSARSPRPGQQAGSAGPAAPAGEGPSRIRTWLATATIAALTVLAHSPGLTGAVQWDDAYWISDNPVLKARQAPWGYWSSARTSDYLPVTASFFWAQSQLWGQNPVGYRAVNVALHVCAAMLLWRLLRKLDVPGAWLAAVIFAVHPVTVASAGWIAEQKNTLSMVLMLAALLAYLRFEDRPRAGWYAGSIFLFAAALLAKSSVVIAPVVLLGFAWWRRGRIGRQDLLGTLPFWVLSAAAAALTVIYQHGHARGEPIFSASFTQLLLPMDPPGNLAERLVLMGRAVWFYLFKLAAPVNLSAIYPRWDVHKITPVGIAALAALSATMAGLLVFARRRRVRPLTFALGYYFVALLPVLGLVNTVFMMYSFVADHWHYLALPGPIALAVGSAWHYLAPRGRLARRAGLALAVAVVAGLAGLTFAQSRHHRTPVALWRHTVDLNPDSIPARSYYARALADAKRFDQAIEQYAHVLTIKPGFAHAYNEMGQTFAEKGVDDENRGDPNGAYGPYRQAEQHFRSAVALDRDYALARDNLAAACHTLARWHAMRGQLEPALPYIAEAAELTPRNAEVQYRKGWILLRMKRPAEAQGPLEQALRLRPQWPAVHFHLGLALADQGLYDAAAEQFRRTLALRGEDPTARELLAEMQALAGQASSAPAANPLPNPMEGLRSPLPEGRR